MFKKSPLKQSRLVKRKRRILLLKISSGFVGCIILISGLAWLSHVSWMSVSAVHVLGTTSIDTQDVNQIASQDLKGSYLYLFSKANRFLYPKSKIQTDVLAAFPRIKDANLNISGHDLNIHITEYTPTYTWCTGTPESISDRTCYFMDSQGYIFSKAPVFSGNVFFAFYGTVSTDTPIRAQYLDANRFDLINRLIGALESLHIHPYALLAESDGVNDLYVNKGTKIIFRDDQSAADLVANLILVIHNENLLGPKATTTLQYIDLRLGNKIYFK